MTFVSRECVRAISRRLNATLHAGLVRCFSESRSGNDERSPNVETNASSNPSTLVYTGPKAFEPRRVSARDLPSFAKAVKSSLTCSYTSPTSIASDAASMSDRLVCVTAYDYPSSVAGDASGADILLVGDSVGMVVHGFDTTLNVTMDMMIMHTQAVVRGRKRAMVVADLPFGSYEVCERAAVENSISLLQKGGADAVKLEGCTPARLAAVRSISSSGIACFGHIGLTPQSVSALGGFRPMGKNVKEAMKIIEEARQLEEAGAVGIVVECVPSIVGAAVTAAVDIPTIGIGAGKHTTGQVLVYHDLLGMMSHPHHEAKTPKFCKRYARIGVQISEALKDYVNEVRSNIYPTVQYSPYKMPPLEVSSFTAELKKQGLENSFNAIDRAERENAK